MGPSSRLSHLENNITKCEQATNIYISHISLTSVEQGAAPPGAETAVTAPWRVLRVAAAVAAVAAAAAPPKLHKSAAVGLMRRRRHRPPGAPGAPAEPARLCAPQPERRPPPRGRAGGLHRGLLLRVEHTGEQGKSKQ